MQISRVNGMQMQCEFFFSDSTAGHFRRLCVCFASFILPLSVSRFVYTSIYSSIESPTVKTKLVETVFQNLLADTLPLWHVYVLY